MSDKRWKAVERATAAALNAVLSDVGNFTPIERIPLLGREGPDLTINEVGLVINVKSRAIIPPRLFPQAKQLLHISDLVCFRMEDLCRVSSFPILAAATPSWKKLKDWWEFMDKWTKEFQPDGITAILIHRPRMPIGHMGIAIHFKDLRRLQCQIQSN